MSEVNIKLIFNPAESSAIEEAKNYELGELVINNDEQNLRATTLLKSIRDQFKLIKALRLSVTKPLDDKKEEVDTFFKPIMKKFETAIDNLSNASISYEKRKRDAAEQKRLQELEAIKEQERLMAEEEARAKEANQTIQQTLQPLTPPEVSSDVQEQIKQAYNLDEVPSTPNVIKASGLRRETIFDIIIEDQTLIPREFMIPDEKKIRALARAKGHEFSMPGVKLTVEERLR